MRSLSSNQMILNLDQIEMNARNGTLTLATRSARTLTAVTRWLIVMLIIKKPESYGMENLFLINSALASLGTS